MVDVQTATVVIAGVSVIIGVLNSIISSRRAEKQRNAELLMGLYSRWSSKEYMENIVKMRFKLLWNDFDDWTKHYGFEGGSVDDLVTFGSTGAFFEGVGVLVEEGYIDIGLVDRLFARHVRAIWEKYEPIIQELRKQGLPQIWDSTEYLYHELKQREQPATVST